jgi:hypothetical protein
MIALDCFHGRKTAGFRVLSGLDGEFVFDCLVLVLEHVAGQIAE